MSPNGLATLDWVVIIGYLAIALGVGVVISRRSRGSAENFFLSGRQLPWWLAGTSMVATSFASDTPLVVTHWTRAGGVAGNWRWWAYLISTVLVVILFAKLWRRSAVMTDVEFMELRYSGRPARFLRAFKGVYQVLFLHCFIMGWVILGMAKVLVVLFDFGTEPVFALGPIELTPAWAAMLGCALMALLYSELAGLWGVVLTDFVQFGFALLGAIVLMFVVAADFGGFAAMADALAAAPVSAGKLSAAPLTSAVSLTSPSTWDTDVWRFVISIGVIWFATKNADGSGVMVQRLLASRDERHAWLATMWYAIAHFALRPWPWIVVALASLLVLPPVSVVSPAEGTVVRAELDAVDIRTEAGDLLSVPIPRTGVDGWEAHPSVAMGDEVSAGQELASTDEELAYPEMMRRYLPAGLLGLLVASFLAAFMSTIDTHVNLASAYLVNDVYRRFVRGDAPAAHYVRAAHVCGPAVLATALVFAANADSMRDMFDVFTSLYAGIGIVYLLRWTWWRINAWSEIAALVASAVTTWLLELVPSLGVRWLPAGLVEAGEPVFEGKLVLVLTVSTLVVIIVTRLTKPVDPDQLRRFYDRVRPIGAWGDLQPADGPSAARTWGRVLLSWIGGTTLVVAAVLLPGNVLLEGGSRALELSALLVVGLVLVRLTLPSRPPRHAPGRP